MIIGIDASRSTAVHRTGTEAYSLHLIRALLSLPTAHRFRLYFNAAPAPGLFPSRPDTEYRVIPLPRLWTHLRLAAEVTRDRPEILFVPAHVLPLAFAGRAVVTVHDLGYRLFPQAHPLLDRLYLDWGTRWNSRRAQVIVADSEVTRQDLMAHYGIDPARIVVAYPGYDETLHPVREPKRLAAVRQRYDIAGDYVLYVGTLQPRKNLIRLVDAFVSLPHTGVQLVLAGGLGWLSAPIVERARRAGVILTGYVPDEDKAALLSGASAFVFPSLYEGFGFPVLEAMACGVPVVCSHTSSLPELVGGVDGPAALLVDPSDTAGLAAGIQRILHDQALRTDLIQRGFDNLKRFSWDNCARQVLAAIEGAAC
jgi:glycosyltransferase involved in cell wall biosynthesis